MNERERKFVATVRDHYERHGRRSLPWRNTKDPYRILVSEIMLQQTQVERVVPKYRAFLKQFPTLSALARAPLGDVLRAWQGLGYNRRAKMLRECAKCIVTDHKGKFPRSHTELMKLPGIGHYTAGAIMAFAWNIPVPIIETNIRSAIIHHFFTDATDITDIQVIGYIEHTLEMEDPREWYYALMDYGAYIKKEFGNPNQRSTHYTKQSPFKGSDRQIRGALLRQCARNASTRRTLLKVLPFEDIRIDAQLERLTKEGMIIKKGRVFLLPNT